MSHVPRLVGAGVAVVVLAGGLVACGGDDEPEAAPSPTASASSSAAGTPSPSEPPPVQLPAEATRKTNDGAMLFAKYWFDVFNEAVAALDSSRLRDISDDKCKLCDAYADHIDDVAKGGGSIVMEPWVPSQPQMIEEVGEDPLPSLSLVVKTTPERLKMTAKSTPRTGGGGTKLYSLSLRWTGERWIMYAFAPA